MIFFDDPFCDKGRAEIGKVAPRLPILFTNYTQLLSVTFSLYFLLTFCIHAL